jgi:endoglucanase
MHGVPDHLKVTRIGEGAAITIMDRSAIPYKSLRDHITQTAEEKGIKYQLRAGTFGGTDSGPIQLARGGVPVACIATPCRYIHSPVNVMSKNDFEAQKALIVATLTNLDKFFNN